MTLERLVKRVVQQERQKANAHLLQPSGGSGPVATAPAAPPSCRADAASVAGAAAAAPAVGMGSSFRELVAATRARDAARRAAAAAANPPDQPAAPRPQQKQEQQPEQQQEHGGKRVAEAEEEGFWAPEPLQPGGEAEEQRSQGRGEAGSDLEQQEQCHPNSQPQQQPAAGMCATTIAITAALGEGWEAEAVAAGDDDW